MEVGFRLCGFLGDHSRRQRNLINILTENVSSHAKFTCENSAYEGSFPSLS